MTMLVEHGATVIPFRDALLRSPKTERSTDELLAHDAPLPDNVVSLARFARRSRRAHLRHWLGGPPEDDAA
jgi:hypothetical protein